jgi:amino acid transporter
LVIIVLRNENLNKTNLPNRFAWIVVIAAELSAITTIFKFHIPSSYLTQVGYPVDHVGWNFGEDTSPAVWVAIFLLAFGAVNLLPVKWYGRLEYAFGCAKITFLTGLIMFNVIINGRKRYSLSSVGEVPY